MLLPTPITHPLNHLPSDQTSSNAQRHPCTCCNRQRRPKLHVRHHQQHRRTRPRGRPCLSLQRLLHSLPLARLPIPHPVHCPQLRSPLKPIRPPRRSKHLPLRPPLLHKLHLPSLRPQHRRRPIRPRRRRESQCRRGSAGLASRAIQSRVRERRLAVSDGKYCFGPTELPGGV